MTSTTPPAVKGIVAQAGRLLRAIANGIQRFGENFIEGLREQPRPPIDVERRRDMMQEYVASYNLRVTNFAKRLVSNDITPREWFDRMTVELRSLHTSARIIGNGGFGGLTNADRLAIEKAVREELVYLSTWFNAIRDTLTPNSESAIAARSRLYGGASSVTFGEAMNNSFGLPKMPFYPAERTKCHRNCGCSWRYVKLGGQGNWDVYWEIGKDDNCDTCVARQRACNPLEVRNGRYNLPIGNDLYA